MKTKYVISGLKIDEDLAKWAGSIGTYAIRFEGDPEWQWHRCSYALKTSRSDVWYFSVEGFDKGSFKMEVSDDLCVGSTLVYDI
jgi:hypothetical protein